MTNTRIRLFKTVLISGVLLITALLVSNGLSGTVYSQDKQPTERKSQQEIEAYKAQQRQLKQQQSDANIQEQKQQKQGLSEVQREQDKANIQVQKTRDENQDRIEEARKKQCEMAAARINNRINSYDSAKDRHTSRYNGISNRISALPDKLESMGCDVEQHKATLEGNLETLNGLIEEFHAAQRQFASSMQSSRTMACQEDGRPNFSRQVLESRQHSQTIREKSSAIQRFFTGTLRSNVQQMGQACRVQLSDQE